MVHYKMGNFDKQNKFKNYSILEKKRKISLKTGTEADS